MFFVVPSADLRCGRGEASLKSFAGFLVRDDIDQLGRMERTAAGKKADKTDQVEILDEQRQSSSSRIVTPQSPH